MKENGKEKKNSFDVVVNTISRGTVLEGKITTEGDIRVEGVVKGTIICKAKLSVSEHGMIDGDVDARNAFISGTVKGKVVVRELLQLQESGKINGDIITQKLSVQVGALFTGNCRMGSEARAAFERKNAESNHQPVDNPALREPAPQAENTIKNPALNIPRIPS